MAARRTNDATPSLLERPELRSARVASVAMLQPLDRVYSYLVPDEYADRLAAGMRVRVPFGRKNRPAVAFCVGVSEEPWRTTLKPLIEPIDERPVLSEALLELGRWIARYYCSHLGRTLDLMVPAAAKRGAGLKSVRYVRLIGSGEGLRLSPAGRRVMEKLVEAGGRAAERQLCESAGCKAGVIAGLVRNGCCAVEIEPAPIRFVPPDTPRREPDFELNADQKAAIEQITSAVAAREFSVQVLFGVTGSGKTEVYVAAVRRAVEAGLQAIMLVPEIALTSQTTTRLECRFDRVATLHSGLSDVERSQAWAAIAAGLVDVVIGTRSAVFAPCPRLGLIVVDEEHEPSYKNQAGPRYHTRDVAIKRAQLAGAPVVLGSATPSLETWKNLDRRHYRLIRLPQRVRGLPMPRVRLVDMREERRRRPGVHLLSCEMEAALGQALGRGEQAVLLLNRRGYANYLHCARCRHVITCPHCSVRMVFHSTTGRAHCHYCHARCEVPTRCPTAGCDGRLVRFGLGTQRVEEELSRKFPQARVRRMDSDVMKRAGDYAEVLGAFERREFDVLVGTQMIAKGLDFPFVSFVGVVSADTALVLNDFRSEERTFQLVLQVAGRSGRGDAPGDVVVQTFARDTAAIQHAVAGDYEAFARVELANRKRCRLPPYTRLMRIVLADPKITKVQQAAGALAQRVRTLLEQRGIAATVFGPRPAPIPRLRDAYRYDVQVNFGSAAGLLAAVDLFKSEAALRAGVKSMAVDVDPVSLQ